MFFVSSQILISYSNFMNFKDGTLFELSFDNEFQIVYDTNIYNISNGWVMTSMMSDVYFIESSIINATYNESIIYCEKTQFMVSQIYFWDLISEISIVLLDSIFLDFVDATLINSPMFVNDANLFITTSLF